jgi:hypothetical protein
VRKRWRRDRREAPERACWTDLHSRPGSQYVRGIQPSFRIISVGRTGWGDFTVRRTTIRKRMRAKLQELRKRRLLRLSSHPSLGISSCPRR